MAGATRINSRRCLPCTKSFSKKQLAVLGALSHCDDKQRSAILRTADKSLVKCICECALNVLHGVVKLRDSEKKKLNKHKIVLRRLINRKSSSWKTKKRALVQNGGSFLPALLAPIVGALISKLFVGGGKQ